MFCFLSFFHLLKFDLNITKLNSSLDPESFQEARDCQLSFEGYCICIIIVILFCSYEFIYIYNVYVQGIDLYRYECHVCGQRYTRGSGLTNHLKKKHRFSWPAGHPRFRYKECDDGICRLQTVRFESLHLSQLMNEQEGAGNTDMQAGDFPQDCVDSPTTSGGSPESTVEGSPLNKGDNLGELNYQELLQEWNKNNSSTQEEGHKGGGPIRSAQTGRVTEVHPYERPESPELDLPQTLLDLQDAAIRLANGQNGIN